MKVSEKKTKITAEWFKSGETGFECEIKLPAQDKKKIVHSQKSYVPFRHNKKLMKYVFSPPKFHLLETQ